MIKTGSAKKYSAKAAATPKGVSEMAKKSPSTAAVTKRKSPPVTEKPAEVPALEMTSEYVVTVNNLTGLLAKIEKVDGATGSRAELSADEYTQTLGYPSPSAYADQMFAQVQLYYQGLSDYVNAMSAGDPYAG